MFLQLSLRIDALLKERLVLNCHVDTPENSTRDTEPCLKVPFVVDGRKTTETKVVT